MSIGPVPQQPLRSYEAFKEQIEKLSRSPSRPESRIFGYRSQSITDRLGEIAAVRKQLENVAYEQETQLKKKTLNRLFRFLTCETVAVFLFALMQGFEWRGFWLDEWSFRLLIAATIAQITLMLRIAVKHLFPGGEVK